MATQNNATCSICGNPYYKCLSCRDMAKLQPWKMFTDSAEHYKVLQAIRGYNTGVYTKDEFKSKLKNIDLSDLESYKDNIKTLIKDVLKEEEPVVEPVVEEAFEEPVVEEAFEEPVVEEVFEEIATEEESVIKVATTRKRNYRANDEVEKVE